MKPRGVASAAAEPLRLSAAGLAGRRFTVWMIWTVALLVISDILLAWQLHLRPGEGWLRTGLGLAVLAIAAWYCRWRPLPRLIVSSELAVWAIILTNALSVLIQIAGRSPRPLADESLMRLDAAFHFHTAFMVHAADAMPHLRLVLAICYRAVEPMILAVILVLPFFGCESAARRFILAVVFAAVVTAAVFALWPAVGPWTTEGFRPDPTQFEIQRYVAMLRSRAAMSLEMQNAGIVAFPSFHVVLAIESAWALSAIRALRLPVWTLALLIGLSTLTTGWHYGTDVCAGIVLAVVSIFLSNCILPDDQSDGREAGTGAQESPQTTMSIVS